MEVAKAYGTDTTEAVYSTKKDNSVLTSNDFLKLFIKELQSQDFSSPMDSSEMMNQITQFSNMQMMQSMANFSKSSYAVSLIGKSVSVSTTDDLGQAKTVSGTIDRVALDGEDYVFYIGKDKFSIDQITEIKIDDSEDKKSDDSDK